MKITKFVKSCFIAVAAMGATQAIAQTGESCGCPELSSRTVVNVPAGNITADQTWTCDNVYKLSARTYVTNGATLTIEPGTVVKGLPAADVLNPAALIVTRDAELIAKGTEDCQIIFTADADPVDGSYSINNAGQWGGLIMLGRATNNITGDENLAVTDGQPGLAFIEGLEAPDARHQYGADLNGGESFDDNDSSGHLEYVSIRHGGITIGTDNEINGLTLGSVGAGTTLKHIEVVGNADDGIEFFGGTVNLSYASVLFCKDDYIDWDHGYSGKIQFVYGVQHPDNNTNGDRMGDNGMEMDSDDQDTNGDPKSNPTVFNVTLIGNGNDIALHAKERTHGNISNSIFCNFAQGLELDTEGVDAAFLSGDFTSNNNTFIGIADNLTVEGAAAPANVTTVFNNSGNVVEASGIIDFDLAVDPVSNTVTNSVNPVPASATDVATDLAAPADGFFCAAPYRGAFAPGQTPWHQGGYLGQLAVDATGVACPTDFNFDGVTNNADFLFFLGSFNTSCSQ